MAVNLFTGATNANWGTATNWSQGTVPTATDGHVTTFDATSPNCSQNVSGGVCNSIDFTNYTNTITMNNSISVSGDITLGSGMTAVGSAQLVINKTGNVTSNGYVWPLRFLFGGTAQVYTLQDDFYVTGSMTLAGTTSLTINNNGTAKTLYAGDTLNGGSGGCAGTAKIVMNGTGQIATTAAIRNDLDFNTTGTITIGTNFRYAGGTLTYVAGTIDTITNNSTFTIGLSGVTTTVLDVGAISWWNIFVNTSNTYALTSDLICLNTFTNSGTVVANGPGNIHISSSTGTGFQAGGGAAMTGTAKLIFDGTDCTWTSGTGIVSKDVDIDTSGTLTLTGGGGCQFRLATMTHINGSVIMIGDTHILTSSLATWDTGTVVLQNVSLTQSTQTLNSTFYVTNLTLGTASTVTFAGSFGFDVDHLIHTTTNRTVSFTAGNTYTVNESITATGSGAVSASANSVTLQSLTVSSPTYINFGPTCVCHCRYVRVIDIDSSGGREMYTVKGLLIRSTNWIRTDPDPYQFF